jgi:hypothetical protein
VTSPIGRRTKQGPGALKQCHLDFCGELHDFWKASYGVIQGPG